jgi:hypothetical protein
MKTINSILLVPKDQKLLDFETNMFLPPQAYDSGYGKWNLYSPYERPPYGGLHTFALILYWEGKPVMAGLDFFARGMGNVGGPGWEWPHGNGQIDRSPEAIIRKVKSWGRYEDSYGELILLTEDKVEVE